MDSSPMQLLILKAAGKDTPAAADSTDAGDTREARLTLMRKFIKGVSSNKPEMALDALDALNCEGDEEDAGD